jgi:phospholipase C
VSAGKHAPRAVARAEPGGLVHDVAMMSRLDRIGAAWHLRRRDKTNDDDRLPNPSLPAGTDCLPEIGHIVVLMMENHSFDNYFGMLGHGEGFTVGPDGKPTAANTGKAGETRSFRFESTAQHSGVPTQSWNASHLQFADGANDGFVASIEQTVPGGDASVAMGYWTAEDLPFYSGLARTFALADRWYSPCLGPTFPNRRFLIAGTANGLIDDVLVGMIDYPSTGTIFDLLDRHGISWTNYHHVKPFWALLKRVFARGVRGIGLALANIFPSLLNTAQGNLQYTANVYPLGAWRALRHLRSIDRFFAQAAKGDLPAVSIVDPDFRSCSEENPQDIRVGEGFAASVIDAVMHGPGWPQTLLVWLYDEHGGYYDHVPPPAAVEPDTVLPRSLLTSTGPFRWLLQKVGMWKKLQAIDTAGRYDRYGFRVPAVIVSPYAKAGYVSSTAYDHTSILKLIEKKWNLPPLTERDEAAADPLDMIDLHAPPAFLRPPTLPAPATPWPAVTPAVSLRVRTAQAAGLVGRTIPHSVAPEPGAPHQQDGGT